MIKNCIWIKTDEKHSNGKTIQVCSIACGNRCVSNEDNPKLLAACRSHRTLELLAKAQNVAQSTPVPQVSEAKGCGGCGKRPNTKKDRPKK